MTKEEFKKEIKRRYRYSDAMVYFTCVLIFGVGVYFFIDIMPGLKDNYPKSLLILTVPIMPISMAIYVAIKVRNSFFIHEITSSKSLIERTEILESYLIGLGGFNKREESEYWYYSFNKGFLCELNLRVHHGDVCTMFNLQNRSTIDKGIMDFCSSSRVSKKLKVYLEANF